MGESSTTFISFKPTKTPQKRFDSSPPRVYTLKSIPNDDDVLL